MKRAWEKFRKFAEDHPEWFFWVNIFLFLKD